jgi:hypothetical protein
MLCVVRVSPLGAPRLMFVTKQARKRGGLSEGILFQFIRQYFSFINALSSLINGPCHSPIQCVDQGTQLLDECRR